MSGYSPGLYYFKKNWAGRVALNSSLFALLLAAASPTAALADINAWTNPTSSAWELPSNWSLGVLPNSSQSVYITNAGFKAVGIDANTAQNFPQSMQIQGLEISAPDNSLNVLLMNFSGFQVPLQTTGVTIETNCSLVVQSSWFQDSGDFFLRGTVDQGDSAKVGIHGNLQIFNLSDSSPPGSYFLTNGTLSVDAILALGRLGNPAVFVQYGGSNNVGSLMVGNSGEYDLYGGDVNATNGLTDGGGDFATTSSFYQYGGNVNADVVINGNYTLNGGNIIGNMQVVSQTSFQRVDANVLQTGGTNHAITLSLGDPNRFGGGANYTLSNGVLQADSAVPFRGGHFVQYGGQFTIASNLVMQGETGGLGPTAEYLLGGGTLSAAGLAVQASAHYNQTGGANSIAGPFVIGPTPPSLSCYCTMSGGSLNAQDIEIHANAFFQHTSGNIAQSGALILAQGQWHAANGDYTLGPLKLGTPDPSAIGSTNSTILFPNGSSILRLGSSAGQSWDSSAILYLNNWHGSPAGDGATQIYVGSDSSGLTAQQLSQIRFTLSNGLAGATILSTGEVVPAPPPPLEVTRNSSSMTLSWPSGWTLQSTTNLSGPYVDVSGASSPWPVSFTQPQEFFRLRK